MQRRMVHPAPDTATAASWVLVGLFAVGVVGATILSSLNFMGGTAGRGTKVGERVRIYIGVGGFLSSSFHVIGEIFDTVYPEGAVGSAPRHNVQTTSVPPGGAAMVEFTVDVPGTYRLVDHALPRALNKGAAGHLVVTGAERPEIFSGGGGGH